MGKAKTAHRKKGRKPKLVPELVAASLERYDGNLKRVAKKFSVQRASVQDLIRDNTALQQVLRDAREGMKDEGESALYRAVKNGEAWAVCFYLKTQAKDRGYIERVEQTGANGVPLNQGGQNVNVAVVNTMPTREAVLAYLRENGESGAGGLDVHQNGEPQPLDRGDGVQTSPEARNILTPHRDS